MTSEPFNKTAYFKPGMRIQTTIAAITAVLGFLAIVGCVAYGSFDPAAAEITGNIAKILYCLWTIGVPLWFFYELVFGFTEHKPEDAAYLAERDQLRTFQEAARPVWAACAAILGVVLLKID